MSERSPLPEVLERPERGRVLLFAPHPDDDILGAGGTCALHVEQGDPVRVVVAYDGMAGDPDGLYEGQDYRALRQRETLAGGEELGLSDYEFWDYPEGHEPSPAELASAIARATELVRSFAPDIVYAPWIGESHLDHHVLARVVRTTLEATSFDGAAWGYEVWTPLVATRIVDISAVFERKARALGHHESQRRYRPTDHIMRGLNANRSMYLDEGLWGEAFRPL